MKARSLYDVPNARLLRNKPDRNDSEAHKFIIEC